MNHQRNLLVIGDILIITLIAGIGFASHGTLGVGSGRLLATLIPFLAAWFASAIPLRAYASDSTLGWGIWRLIWAVILSAPLGAWLRGVWLQMPVQTTFVFVMIAFLLLGIIAWRLLVQFVIFPRIINKHG